MKVKKEEELIAMSIIFVSLLLSLLYLGYL